MPYRQVHLGGGEYALARISDEAIKEWLSVRRRNKNLGYPDRPPDIDTDYMRSWIQHPGDPGYEELKNQSSPNNSFPVLTIAQEDLIGLPDPIEAKVIIGYNEGEGYIFRFVVRKLYTGETIMDKQSVQPEWDEQYYEDVLALYSSMFIHPYSEPSLISTYFEYDEALAETELAERELKEYSDALRLN